VRQGTCGEGWAPGAPAGSAPQLMRDSLGSSMRRLYFIAVTLLAACAAAHAPIPVRDGRAATIGCYRLVQGAWSSRDLWSTGVQPLQLPDTIQLHPTGAATPDLGLLGASYPALNGTWRTVLTDSLIVIWSDGPTTVRLALMAYPESLVGTARVDAHVVGVETPVAHVLAKPASCS
jgi:hypothetical protein